MAIENMLPPSNLYAHVFAVKTHLTPRENLHLLEIGLKGNCKAEMKDGVTSFTGLKFKSTSYNNESQLDNSINMIHACISPPIFIDSRKSARDKKGRLGVMLFFFHLFILANGEKQKGSSAYEHFDPEVISKTFVKRNCKVQSQTQVEVTNSMAGLLNYISAPNIRNKIKHPLFLAIKFSSCVKVFYNQFIFPVNLRDKEFPEIFIKRMTSIPDDGESLTPKEEKPSGEQLMPLIDAKKAEEGPRGGYRDEEGNWVFSETESNGGFLLPHWIRRGSTQFLVLFEPSEPSEVISANHWKRFNEFLEPMVSKYVAFVYKRSLINANWFVQVENIDEVSQKYKAMFQSSYPRVPQGKEDASDEENSMIEFSTPKKGVNGSDLDSNWSEYMSKGFYPMASCRGESQFSIPRDSMMSFVQPNEVMIENQMKTNGSNQQTNSDSSLLSKRNSSSIDKKGQKVAQNGTKKMNVDGDGGETTETTVGTSKNSDETEGSSKASKNEDECSGSGSSKENNSNSSQGSPNDPSRHDQRNKKESQENQKPEKRQKGADAKQSQGPNHSQENHGASIGTDSTATGRKESAPLPSEINVMPMGQAGQFQGAMSVIPQQNGLLMNQLMMGQRGPFVQANGQNGSNQGQVAQSMAQVPFEAIRGSFPAVGSLFQQVQGQEGFLFAPQQVINRPFPAGFFKTPDLCQVSMSRGANADLGILRGTAFGGQSGAPQQAFL